MGLIEGPTERRLQVLPPTLRTLAKNNDRRYVDNFIGKSHQCSLTLSRLPRRSGVKIEEVEIDIGNELQESTGTNNADKVHVWGVCISVFSPELYNMGY